MTSAKGTTSSPASAGEGVALTSELLQRHHDFHEFVLERFQDYTAATRGAREPRGYDYNSWYLDGITADSLSIAFTGSDYDGCAIDETVSLSVLDIWSMSDAEFQAMLPRLKEERRAQVVEQKLAEEQRKREASETLARRLEEQRQEERDRIFREECAARGIEVPS